MNYKLKLQAVNRLRPSVNTVVNRYYADDVGSVRHTPRTMARLFKKNLKERGIRAKRSELRRFAKVAFLLYHQPNLSRKHVEVLYAQLVLNAFILQVIFGGFKVSVNAVKKVLARIALLIGALEKKLFGFLDDLKQVLLYLSFSRLLL